MNVPKACIWPFHVLHNVFVSKLWLWPTNCELETQSFQQSLMSVLSWLIPLSRMMQSFGDISLSQKPTEHPGPADSFLRANNLLLSAGSSQLERSLWLPEGNTPLKWSIVFHGLCPNDWWHFLRHLRRRPRANLERHLNAKILPGHEHSHVLLSQCFTLECVCMLQLIKVLIIALSCLQNN